MVGKFVFKGNGYKITNELRVCTCMSLFKYSYFRCSQIMCHRLTDMREMHS